MMVRKPNGGTVSINYIHIGMRGSAAKIGCKVSKSSWDASVINEPANLRILFSIVHACSIYIFRAIN